MEKLPNDVNQSLEMIKITIDEMKRRLKEQSTFEPGEKEMYEAQIKKGEIFLMNPGSHKN